MHLLAQSAADIGPSLTSATGWGAFGLAVAILGWLAFYHLPAKDKQQTEQNDKHSAAMERKDQQVMTVIANHQTESERQRQAFTSALDRVVEHCREENLALWQKLEKK